MDMYKLVKNVLGRRPIFRPKRICVCVVLSRMAFSSKFWYIMALRVVEWPSMGFLGSVGCGVTFSDWIWLAGLLGSFSAAFGGGF